LRGLLFLASSESVVVGHELFVDGGIMAA